MEGVDITFWASLPCCWQDAGNIYRDRSLVWYHFALELVRQTGSHTHPQDGIKEMGGGAGSTP